MDAGIDIGTDRNVSLLQKMVEQNTFLILLEILARMVDRCARRNKWSGLKLV
jgi:hypothetical protein